MIRRRKIRIRKTSTVNPNNLEASTHGEFKQISDTRKCIPVLPKQPKKRASVISRRFFVPLPSPKNSTKKDTRTWRPISMPDGFLKERQTRCGAAAIAAIFSRAMKRSRPAPPVTIPRRILSYKGKTGN